MTSRTTRTRFKMAGGIWLIVGIAPANAQPQRMRMDPAPEELKLPADAVSIPMHRDHGWAVVEAHVNGHGPFLFLIDTGAPGLVVDSRYKDKMGLAADPDLGGMQVRVAGPGGGDGLPATLHQTGSLRLGTAELLKIKTIATKLPMGRDMAGVIGMGLFRDCLLTLDYPASKVVIEHGVLPPADGREILDFTQPRQHGSHPVLPISVCGKSIDFTLDTGMTGWMAFPENVTEACSFSYGPVVGPKARSVDQEFDTHLARLAGNLMIGGHVIQNPHGHLRQDEGHEPLIGSLILQEFALTIDQKNSRIRFSRKSRSPIIPPAFRFPGFSLREEDGAYVVWGLMPDSPAARAGIADGDIVVSLNDKPPGEVYERPVWTTMLDGDTLRMRFRKAGQENQQTIDVPVMTLIPRIP